MKKILYDIEVYKNFFCVGLKDYATKEITFYEISEEKNEIDKIYKLFRSYDGFLISFNGIHYDNMVIKYLLKNYEKYKKLEWANITLDLKRFSDKIIYSEDYDEEIKNIKYIKVEWIDIDLFLYWSKMLRISKKISLKSLGIQLGYKTVQELPYKPETVLTKEDLPKLRYYNYTHDLGILELLTTKMEDDIKLRANISSDYKLDCWSWDAPKIASEALLLDYCKRTKNNIFEIRKSRFQKETMYLNAVLRDFNPNFKLPIFQKLFEDILNSKDSFSKELLVNENNTSIRLTYGVGGLHSINENEQYYSSEDHQIVTSDVASLYPNLIINYTCIRYPEVLTRYGEVKTERLVAKKEKNKDKDTFLKLILNSTSGLLDNQHSWLYYPEGAMKLRLIGQLILTKCIEACIINKWQVISANTDGIEVIVPKYQLQQYKQILNMVCNKFSLDLEHEYYDKIIYKNVNNYVAVVKDGVKIKRKGFFKIDFDEDGRKEIPLGDSTDELVISKALNAYYTKGIEPEKFINNPDQYSLHIFDYCKSNKISKDFTVYHNNKIQQNLNRYYFTKGAPYLFKQKKSKQYSENDRQWLSQQVIENHGANGAGYAPGWKQLTNEEVKARVDNIIHGNGTYQHINVGNGVTLFNDYIEKPWKEYDINYQYYISKTKKIIEEINRYNQLTLF